MKAKFNTRNIAITDIETTGLDSTKHEIIEIGLVLVKQPSLEIIDTLDIKIKPTRIGQSSPEALEINGYNLKEWENSCSLKEAMSVYLEKTEGAVFSAYNVMFDGPFIKQACRDTNLPYTLDYHYIDIPTLVWAKFRNSKVKGYNLNKLANHLGLEPEPKVHRALNGAMLAYEVLKKTCK